MMTWTIALIYLEALFCFIEAKPAEEPLELVDGDMLLTKEQKMEFEELKSGRVRRAAVLDGRLWPNARVPYTFSRGLTRAGRNLANDAMQSWMDNTCLRFVRRTNERAYVQFQMDGRCRAVVGYGRSRRRKISLGSAANPCSLGSSIHEIGHAIGFYHEHVRPDRDQFITFNESNMRPESAHNFELKTAAEVDSRGHDYDYDSIMHYSRTQGSINGHNVLEPNPPNQNANIGQRNALSPGDIAQARTMYRCDANNDSHFNLNDENGGSGGSGEKEIEIME